MRALYLVVSVVMIMGCSASGPRYSDLSFEKTPGLSEVYIYRLNKFVDGGSCYEISIDGKPVGILGNGGFLRAEISPGKHTASIPMINKNSLELLFDSEESETVYLQFNVSLNSSGGIPESEIISTRADYTYSQGELMNFNNLLVQVNSEYAIENLSSLRDSSEKVSCMATLRYKN
jgi:hypothetical protein